MVVTFILFLRLFFRLSVCLPSSVVGQKKRTNFCFTYKPTTIMSPKVIKKISRPSKVRAITPKEALDARSSVVEIFSRSTVFNSALLTSIFFWMASVSFLMTSELFMTFERFWPSLRTASGHRHWQVRSLKPSVSISADLLKIKRVVNILNVVL